MLERHKGKSILHYGITTTSIDIYTEMHDIWYVWDTNKGSYRKIVPNNIKELFTVESLAHWIIQDGYFDGSGRTQTTLLCTESFTKQECIVLQKVLRNYGIKTSLKTRDKNKNTYRIRISKTSIKHVIELVKNLIPVYYHYKIGVPPAGVS